MRISDWSSYVCSSDRLFEAVEVEQHDRARPLLLREGGERRIELFRDVKAIGEAGQRIIKCQPRRILGRAALCGDVGAAAAIAGEMTAGIDMRASRHRPPARLALRRRAQRQFVAHRLEHQQTGQAAYRKSVVWGKSVSVCVDLGGDRISKKQ